MESEIAKLVVSFFHFSMQISMIHVTYTTCVLQIYSEIRRYVKLMWVLGITLLGLRSFSLYTYITLHRAQENVFDACAKMK
jgi:hypothetical protein